MTASYVALPFVFAFLFIVLQILYHDQFRSEIHLAFHDVTNTQRQLHTELISDCTRFPVMSSDGKLVFDPFSPDPLKFLPWFSAQSSKSNECTLKIKNAADKTETVSHMALFLMAWRWDVKTDIWEAKHANIERLNAASIIEQAPLSTDSEKKKLAEDESLFHFDDACMH